MTPLPNPLVLGDPATGGFSGGVKWGISNNDLRPCDAADCYNYIGTEKNLESREGSLTLNAVPLGSQPYKPIQGLFRFFDGTGHRFFAKCGTSVYDVRVSGEHPIIASGLEEDSEIQFARWFGRYFFVDGQNLWSGTTGAAAKVTLLDEEGQPLDNPPKGHSILIKDQRIYLAYDPDHSTYVYFLETDYYDRFRRQAWVACDRDDGRPIYGMEKHRDKILVFKENQHYFILGDYSLGNLAVIDGAKVGAWSQKAILDCPDGFIRWVGPDGVWEYNDETGHRKIDWDLWNTLKRLGTTEGKKINLGWYDRFLVMAFPEPGSNQCNLVTVFDTRYRVWWPFRDWFPSIMHTATTGELYAGWETEGKIKQLFVGTHDDGKAIECMWKSKQFGTPGMEHRIDSVRTFLQAGQSVNIQWESDAVHQQSGSREFVAGDIGVYLGDENDPLETDFILGDEDTADDGDILISDEDLGQGHEDFRARLRGGVSFDEMSFTITQKSLEKMTIDWVALGVFPSRVR